MKTPFVLKAFAFLSAISESAGMIFGMLFSRSIARALERFFKIELF